MNWFKEKITKIFNTEIEENDYKEVSNEPIEPLIIFEDDEVRNEVETKKSSFVFPLIDDNEKKTLGNNVFREVENEEVTKLNSTKDVLKESNYFYQQNAISEVYEVEVSGIKELLANRRKSKKSYNGVKKLDDYKISQIKRPSSQDRGVREKLETFPSKKKKNLVEAEIPVPQRRFIPTQVPSPIHGYRKPSNINDLINKKHVRESLSLAEDVPLKKESVDNRGNESTIENTPIKTVDILHETEREIASTVDQVVPKKDKDSAILTENIVNHGNVSIEQLLDDNDALLETDIAYINERSVEAVFESSFEHVEDEQKRDLIVKEDKQENASFVIEEQESEPVVIEDKQENAPDVLENEQEELTVTIDKEISTNDVEPIATIDTKEINDFEASIEEKLQIESDLFVDHRKVGQSLDEQVSRLVEVALDEERNKQLLTTEEIVNREGQATSILPSVEENEEVEVTEEVQSAQVDVKEKRNTLPFNVLMLKSDKEKYAKRLAQNEYFQHKVDMNERNEESIKSNPQHREDIERRQVTDENVSINDRAVATSQCLEEEIVVGQDEVLEVEQSLSVDQTIFENHDEEKMKQQTFEESFDITLDEQTDEKPKKVYVKPPIEYLMPPEEKTEDRDWLESQADVLVEALSHFQVTAQVESIMQGPAVTQFEITVGHGTKVSKIRNLADDLKLALAAKDIRIQAPIPGKSSIGIEIPNRISRAVRLSEVTNSESFIESESPLEAALGLDLTGKPVTIDLRKMPHGLIAGATGSGKSVCINSILVSLLYKADPRELKLMLIDPKMVELAPFNHIPHLVSPVITDVKAATAALKWAVEEMERRYQLFAHAGVRDLSRFNRLAESNGDYGHKLPYILIVIDELADLMMMSPADVEEAICRIAQKARACGIHLIVATQRPSVDVITGLIKSNIPTRIAFAVSSQIDSRTILDSQGAERLLGRGDMLYLGNGMSAPIRLQGTFVTDDEIEEIIEHVRAQGEPEYVFQQEELLKKAEIIEEQDELFEEVCRFVYEQGSASTSSIQRKYHIGYNRAARLIDMLESQGLVSEQRGSKAREVYITDNDLTSMFE